MSETKKIIDEIREAKLVSCVRSWLMYGKSTGCPLIEICPHVLEPLPEYHGQKEEGSGIYVIDYMRKWVLIRTPRTEPDILRFTSGNDPDNVLNAKEALEKAKRITEKCSLQSLKQEFISKLLRTGKWNQGTCMFELTEATIDKLGEILGWRDQGE